MRVSQIYQSTCSKPGMRRICDIERVKLESAWWNFEQYLATTQFWLLYWVRLCNGHLKSDCSSLILHARRGILRVQYVFHSKLTPFPATLLQSLHIVSAKLGDLLNWLLYIQHLIKADSAVYLGCYLINTAKNSALSIPFMVFYHKHQAPLGVSYSNTHACALVNAAPIQKYCHTRS